MVFFQNTLVSVEVQADALQYPVGEVHAGEEVRLKNKAHTHCIPP